MGIPSEGGPKLSLLFDSLAQNPYLPKSESFNIEITAVRSGERAEKETEEAEAEAEAETNPAEKRETAMICSPTMSASPCTDHPSFATDMEILLSRARLKCCQNFKLFAEVSKIFQEQVRKYLSRQGSSSSSLRTKEQEQARTRSLHEFHKMLIGICGWQYEKSSRMREKLRWDERYACDDAWRAWFWGEVKVLREEDCKRLGIKNLLIVQGIRVLVATWREGDGERRDPKVDRLEKWAVRKMQMVDVKLEEFREALRRVEERLREEGEIRSDSDVIKYRTE